MSISAFRIAAALAVLLLHAAPARAAGGSGLVTGNGHGFAAYVPAERAIARFYIHPYRFMRADPRGPRADGVPTPSLIDRLSWADAPPRAAGYVDESHVIAIARPGADERAFMPFGLPRCALVTVCTNADAPRAKVRWKGRARAPDPVAGAAAPAWTVAFANLTERALIVALDDADSPACTPGVLAGSRAWAIAVLAPDESAAGVVAELHAWRAGARPGDLAAREVSALEAWRVKPPPSLGEAERPLWRQSETILKLAQVREPRAPGRHGEGLILASLPEGEFFIPWTRDMAYAIVALARMGHGDEARRGLDAWVTAPLSTAETAGPHLISTVRYYGDGSVEADYSGHPRPNVEYDSWGLALWAAGEYVTATGDTGWLRSPTPHGTAYEALRDHVVGPLLAKLEPHGGGVIVAADSSVWEQNDEPYKHHAFSSLAAAVGLARFAQLAALERDEPARRRAAAALERLRAGIASAFVVDGRLRGRLEGGRRNDMDGALIEAINLGAVQDPAVARATLARLPLLAVQTGGWRRTLGTTPYERQEFVFLDVAVARAYLREGDRAKAEAIAARLTERAARDAHQLPEMYLTEPGGDFEGAAGDPTGAIPMAGYGAGAFAIYVMERAGLDRDGRARASLLGLELR